LALSGDSALVPRLHEALAWFLTEQNFCGRDLIAAIMAGIQGRLPYLPCCAHAPLTSATTRIAFSTKPSS
jgi:hypothetical protein